MNNAFFRHGLQTVEIVKDNRDFYVNLALAVITLFAVMVALFQEWIKKALNKTRLEVQINKQSPDCHQILLTAPNGRPVSNCIYSRIRVTNLNKTNTSYHTEVFISHFWQILRSGNKAEIKTFLPMNLKWSHTHESNTNILPNIYRYCDFGSFRNDGNGIYLLIDTIVQPNPVSGGIIPNKINPGKYEFEIITSGENVKPLVKKWKLEFGNFWSDDELAMLKHIKIKEI